VLSLVRSRDEHFFFWGKVDTKLGVVGSDEFDQAASTVFACLAFEQLVLLAIDMHNNPKMSKLEHILNNRFVYGGQHVDYHIVEHVVDLERVAFNDGVFEGF